MRPPLECWSDGGEKGVDALDASATGLPGRAVRWDQRGLSGTQRVPEAAQDRLAGLAPRDVRVLAEPIQNSHQKLGVRMIKRDCGRVRRCHSLPIFGNMLPIAGACVCWTDMD